MATYKPELVTRDTVRKFDNQLELLLLRLRALKEFLLTCEGSTGAIFNMGAGDLVKGLDKVVASFVRNANDMFPTQWKTFVAKNKGLF